jgi:hypothetical protein
MTSEPPAKLAQAVGERLQHVGGIAAVTITSGDGIPFGSMGETDARRDAVLAAFLATRVQAMTAEGDLRGKGWLLRQSRLLHASCSGRNREYLVVPHGSITAFATVKPDAYPDVVLDQMLSSLQPGQAS